MNIFYLLYSPWGLPFMSTSVLQTVNSVNVLCFIYDPYDDEWIWFRSCDAFSLVPHIGCMILLFYWKCFNFNVFCKGGCWCRLYIIGSSSNKMHLDICMEYSVCLISWNHKSLYGGRSLYTGILQWFSVASLLRWATFKKHIFKKRVIKIGAGEVKISRILISVFCFLETEKLLEKQLKFKES